MAELPPARRLDAGAVNNLRCPGSVEDGVGLDLPEAIKVELTDKRGKVVVLEKLGNILGGEGH